MEKDVIISIKGMQHFTGMEGDRIELVTQGRLAGDESGYTLTYQESELTGLGSTQTVFQVQPDRVTLMRSGEINFQMVFQEGRRHLSLYETPYGSLSVGVNTRHMSAQLGEHGGELEIDYNIEIDHSLAGRNVFQIRVREPGALKQ